MPVMKWGTDGLVVPVRRVMSRIVGERVSTAGGIPQDGPSSRRRT